MNKQSKDSHNDPQKDGHWQSVGTGATVWCLQLVLSLLGVLLLSSIEVYGSTNPNVRVVNVLRDAANQTIDVYVDEEPEARFVGLSYLWYSSEMVLSPQTHRIVITESGVGRSNPIGEIELSISPDSSYTVYVLGSLPEVRVVSRGIEKIIGNDSLIVRCVQVTDMTGKFYVTVRDPTSLSGSVIELPLFDGQSKTWGDSIGYWKERQLVAGRIRVWLGGGGLPEDRPYTGHYREGSVVTFVVVGEYGNGSGDLGVYSLVESDSGGGMLHRLREKGVGDGSVRPVSLAADLYTTEYTVDGVLLGYDPRRYSVVQRVEDFLGTINIKMARRHQSTRDTLIDEDLYVGADTLTTAILVGTEATGYSVVSLATPLVYDLGEARSRLRVFHGASSVGAVDVVFKLSDGSIERFNGVRYKGSSEYRELLYGPVVAELYRSGEQVAFARKRGYLPVDSQMTLMVIGGSEDSLGIALLVDTDSNYQAVKLWPEAGATGVGREEGITGEPKGLSVMVYPNPSSNEARVSFRLEQRSIVGVEICTMTGIVKVSGRPQEYEQGNNEITLPIGALPAGPYLVRLSTGNQATVRLLTIVR